VLESLGVYEHWNNPADKKNSRNLGTGLGIDLHNAGNVTSTGQAIPNTEPGVTCYPNPFSTYLAISATDGNLVERRVKIYNMSGILVFQTDFQGSFTLRAADLMSAGVRSGTLLIIMTDLTGTKVMGRLKVLYQPL
jgi:hypothetical protein